MALLRLLEPGSETGLRIFVGGESLEQGGAIGKLSGGIRIVTLRTTLHKNLLPCSWRAVSPALVSRTPPEDARARFMQVKANARRKGMRFMAGLQRYEEDSRLKGGYRHSAVGFRLSQLLNAVSSR
jgi:hypothetical protein